MSLRSRSLEIGLEINRRRYQKVYQENPLVSMSQGRNKSDRNKIGVSVTDKPKAIDEEITEDAIQIIETAKQIDPKLFEGISHQKRQNLIRGLALSISIQKSHSGSLPDPRNPAEL